MNRADKNIDTFEWQDALQKNAVLLTVNQRLARHYHSMYQDWRMSQGAVSWETPQILPLDAWLAQLHQLAVAQSLSKKVLLHDLAARQLWRQCIEWDLTHYRGNDALVSLLNVDAAAAEAGKAWSIEHQWQVNVPNDTPLSKDQCAYARWRKRYQRRCLEEGWIDSSMLGLHVVELLRAPSGLDIPQHVLTAGFLSINPLQQMLLEQLTKNGIQCDDIPLLGREPQNCCQSIYDGGAEELASVAARCRRLLEASPTCRMGVVVPALAMRRQALVRAFDAEFFPGLNPEQIMAIGRPYDVSLGVPLLELPPIRAAITSLQFLIAGLDSSAVSQWLVSPYLIDATGQAVARRRLDQALRRESLQRYTLTTWHPAKGDSALVRAIAAVGKLQVRSSKTLSDYADFFSKVLEALGWPGHSLGSEEFQAVQVWQSVLDDMQHVDDGSALSAPQAFVELQRLCRDRVFQPESARVPIQVMGRLESHGLSFDALMLVGMDSAHWPPSTSANTFLPFSIQKEAGVPESSKEHQLALARAELSFWQSAAKQVWFTSARLREGQECSTTDLLSAVALERCDEYSTAKQSVAAQMRQHGRAELISVVDHHGPVIPKDEKVIGGARLFEDQAQCPFRAFALHRLRVRPLEEATLGLDPRAHGNLLHMALEYFWHEVGSQVNLVSLADDALSAQILSCIDRSLDDNNVALRLRELERTRLLSLMLEWFTHCEKRRAAFDVEELEVEREVSYQGFNLTLKVDRVDRLPSGQKLIIDYKTGTNNNPKGWAEARIENPQLPLYALISDNVEGVSYAQIAINDCRFKGIASDSDLLRGVVSRIKSGDTEIADWESWLRHWRTSLDALAEELRTGLATITPTKKACQYCDLPALCRIDDIRDEHTELEAE